MDYNEELRDLIRLMRMNGHEGKIPAMIAEVLNDTEAYWTLHKLLGTKSLEYMREPAKYEDDGEPHFLNVTFKDCLTISSKVIKIKKKIKGKVSGLWYTRN